MPKSQNNIIKDLAIIALSAVIAIDLAKSDVLVKILTSSQGLEQFGSFIAGMFFTSIFTTIPSIVTLGEIAQVYPVLYVAFFGAIGSVFGDLLIFRFVKDRLSEDLAHLLKHSWGGQRLRALFRLKYFRWFTFFVGGLIIASPLPDELGVSLLGFSKMKTSLFIPLSFVLNFVGIYIIGVIAQSLA